MLTIRFLTTLLVMSALGGCAALPTPVAPGGAPPAADRRAILAMAGEYRIRFDFRETVALAAGYPLKPEKISEATEWVTVIEESPQRIVLQHILVLGDEHHVVKHWRQDWTWQPRETWVFEGHKRWTRRALAPTDARGQWQQSVWEVDDSPRYFGIGRWEHADGLSSWTSAPSPRPLPRREYTTRDDYDILLAVNRHALTPDGWVHEQDNTKIVARDGERRALARETGVNTYTRLQPGDYDFSAGRDYWQRSAAFWSDVRRQWTQRMAQTDELRLHESVDGRLLYEVMFEMAKQRQTPPAMEIVAVLDRYTRSD